MCQLDGTVALSGQGVTPGMALESPLQSKSECHLHNKTSLALWGLNSSEMCKVVMLLAFYSLTAHKVPSLKDHLIRDILLFIFHAFKRCKFVKGVNL